jgi:hypothetical protein
MGTPQEPIYKVFSAAMGPESLKYSSATSDVQRLLASLAIYRFVAVLAIYFATLLMDPVAVVGIVITAIASLVLSIAREPEIYVVIVPLIALVDSVGLVLALSSLAGIAGAIAGDTAPYIAFYLAAVAWDVEVFRLSRTLSA